MRVVSWSTELRDGVRLITALTICEEPTPEGITRAHVFALDKGDESPRYTIWEIGRDYQARQVFPFPQMLPLAELADLNRKPPA